MVWHILYQVIQLVIAIIHLRSRSDTAKDFEILLLRRELAIMKRHHQGVVRPERPDKLFLTTLMMQLKKRTGYKLKQLQEVVSIVQLETVLGWHREIVRRKWIHKRQSQGG